MRLDFWRLLPRLEGSGPEGDDASSAVPSDDTPPQTIIASSSAGSLPASSAASAAASAAATPSDTVIDFQASSNFPDSARVFYSAETTTKDIRWVQLDNSVQIKTVSWLGKTDHDADDYSEIIKAEAQDDSSFTVSQPFDDVSDSEAILDLSAVAKQPDFVNHLMAIKIDWESNLYSGYSQSPVFAVAVSRDAETLQKINQDIEQEDSSLKEGTQTFSDAIPSATGSRGASPESTPIAGPSDDGNGGSDGSDNENADSSSGGGGGLSTGAIAGIAVAAAVIFILVAAALVWFLIRRRRAAKLHAGYAPQANSNTFMVEKADGHDRPPPDSPPVRHSDDGASAPALVPTTAGVPDGGPDERQHALASYDDDRPIDDNGALRDVSPGSGGATERRGGGGDVSRSVAHLVEDGMTPEEIRRLEEEERQLDAEIERAGRH